MTTHATQHQQYQQLPASEVARYSEIFDAYADTDASPQGARCMSPVAFAQAITPSAEASGSGSSLYAAFFAVADREARGMLTKDDFIYFQTLLSQHDAASSLPFHAVSRSTATGTVEASALARLIGNDNAASNYLRGKSHVSYAEFAQLIESARADRIRSAFASADTEDSGSISPEQAYAIAREFAPLESSSIVASRLSLLGQSPSTHAIGYPTFLALVSLLSDPVRIRRAVDEAVHSLPSKKTADASSAQVTRPDFASATSLLTPLEIDVLFTLAAGQTDAESVTLSSINDITHSCYKSLVSAGSEQQQIKSESANIVHHKKPSRTILQESLFQAYNFAVGAVAGGIGAAVVYPIDLVKTRMQNQRVAVVGEMMYKNSIDCFRKVIRNEGVLGLYRGLGPQLVGVAPEKAIKLTVNDFVRARLTDKDTGKIAFASELIAGGTAGASQVVFTNPLEIVKIRLQIQGEMLKETTGAAAPIARRGAVTIIKELGLLGLYKGASACLLRDVPFSAIYFSCYSHLKKDVFREGERQLGIVDLLLAGAIAGMPAAYLTTPADVIKTRLQVVAKKGETVYNGLFDAARKIYKEEGFKAFFKGGPARIVRSSPQFGTTLMCYELIHRMVPFPGEEHDTKPSVDRMAQRARELSSQTALFQAANALRLLHDSNYKFGSPVLPAKPSASPAHVA
ncbi:mitochondrial aspartate-glutamate transporter agc1 [Coemansia erecta]|uniref:Mitochondrial aspartate-glutamate transporter AGC1 n=1 Tax=Coemansia erecta TaxID=147472 RepID=A0A9W7Y0I4_9FUNG|nr:mitochondrial aspartate-glutamate transporter agc1 [Coemansia erecta]